MDNEIVLAGNDYIAISEIDKTFEVIEELIGTLILHYSQYKENSTYMSF